VWKIVRLIHRPIKTLKLVFAAVAGLLYVIKFVSDVLQVSGFLQTLIFLQQQNQHD
jgi:hypothetical protein